MSSRAYTTVRNSTLHGKGLFACHPIKEGQVIGRVKGRPTRKDGPYVLWKKDRMGFRVCCKLKYINHSSTPNAVYYDSGLVVALTDITANEEITHHYGWS